MVSRVKTSDLKLIWVLASALAALLVSPVQAAPQSRVQAPGHVNASLEKRIGAVRVAPGCFLHDVDPACGVAKSLFEEIKFAYLQDPEILVSTLARSLDQITSQKNYNYFAVFASVLCADSRLIRSLENLAAREKKFQARFSYAAQGWKRIKDGSCPQDSFNTPEYSEICTFEDAQFTRARLMLQKGGK